MGFRSFSILLFTVVGILFFQNCSDVGFQTGTSTESANMSLEGGGGSEGDEAFGRIHQGLIGGHFDLDTSSQLYPPSQGKTDHHVHEYDDKFNVTYADYFRLLDEKFHNINEIIAPSEKFTLVILNAQLSPGGMLSINGIETSVMDYQMKADRTVYTLDGSSGTKLNSLKIGFKADTLSNGGLIGTETSCVVRNDLGPKGEERNGALIIRAMSLSGALLWESTIFWHWGKGCYR